MLNTLEGLIGDETMARVMRTYAERWRFGHPSSDDFYAVATEVSGRDLTSFFKQTVEGTGVNKMSDLKGKRVSTGAPVSGTEVMSNRLLEAFGIDASKDITRERLSVAESVNAIKDGKIDAFTWVGGVPTPAITDLAATPGKKLKLIDHGDGAEGMRKKYGPIYVKNRILANGYPGETRETSNVDVWNLLVVPANADEKLVYEITKTLFEKKEELVKVHKDAGFLELSNQLSGASPIPFHPGAEKYYKEVGLIK